MWNKSLRINCDKLSLSAFAGVAPAIMRGFVAVFLCLWVVIAHAETPESSMFAPTIPNKSTPPREAPEGMVWVPGGEFSMGAAAGGEVLLAGQGDQTLPRASRPPAPPSVTST